MSADRGRADIEHLLADDRLERVAPSQPVAQRLLADAHAHVALARKGAHEDPAGALQLAYDAARKASTALLAVQGLRATTRGGHVAVISAVEAQFGAEVFGKINRLRRRRHASEYPTESSPGVTADDALQAIRVAEGAIAAAEQLLASDQLVPFA